jgi:hypothetical protein
VNWLNWLNWLTIAINLGTGAANIYLIKRWRKFYREGVAAEAERNIVLEEDLAILRKKLDELEKRDGSG